MGSGIRFAGRVAERLPIIFLNFLSQELYIEVYVEIVSLSIIKICVFRVRFGLWLFHCPQRGAETFWKSFEREIENQTGEEGKNFGAKMRRVEFWFE